MLTRRSLLIAAAASAVGGCAREVKPASTAVTAFDVATTGAYQVFAPAAAGSSPEERESAMLAATERWFTPVLKAFNAAHRGLRATYASWLSPSAGGPGTPNPAISALIGEWGGTDLSAELRASNVDTSVLLPGLLQAGQDAAGALRGLPIDVMPYAVSYGPAHAFSAARIPQPLPTWSTDQFAAFCADVAKHGGAFAGELVLGGEGGMGSRGIAWQGYVQGYGGAIVADGRIAITTSEALRGLTAFADLLEITSQQPHAPTPPLQVSLGLYNRTVPQPLGTAAVRFPRAPLPVVPAGVNFVSVPASAPHPTAGAIFALWLLTADGQRTLTSIGFPSVRTDIGPATSWLTKGPTAVNPADLRFSPPQLQSLRGVQLTPRLYGILTRPSAGQAPALRQLEQVCNGVLAGDTNPLEAEVQLNRDGIRAAT